MMTMNKTNKILVVVDAVRGSVTKAEVKSAHKRMAQLKVPYVIQTIDELTNGQPEKAQAVRREYKTEGFAGYMAIVFTPDFEPRTRDNWYGSPMQIADGWADKINKIEVVIRHINPITAKIDGRRFAVEGKFHVWEERLNRKDLYPHEMRNSYNESSIERRIAHIWADALGFQFDRPAYERYEDTINQSVEFGKNVYNRLVEPKRVVQPVKAVDTVKEVYRYCGLGLFNDDDLIIARSGKGDLFLFSVKNRKVRLIEKVDKEMLIAKENVDNGKTYTTYKLVRVDSAKRITRQEALGNKADKSLNTSREAYCIKRNVLSDEECKMVYNHYIYLKENNMLTDEYIDTDYTICPKCGNPVRIRGCQFTNTSAQCDYCDSKVDSGYEIRGFFE